MQLERFILDRLRIGSDIHNLSALALDIESEGTRAKSAKKSKAASETTSDIFMGLLNDLRGGLRKQDKVYATLVKSSIRSGSLDGWKNTDPARAILARTSLLWRHANDPKSLARTSEEISQYLVQCQKLWELRDDFKRYPAWCTLRQQVHDLLST